MERSAVLVASLVALAVVVAVDLLLIAIIQAQGPSLEPYVPRFVASYLAVMAGLVAIALVPRPEVAVIRVPLRAAAAAGLLVAGIVGAFSIGIPLVVGGILMSVTVVRTRREPGTRLTRLGGLVGAALAIAILVGGLVFTQRIIVCPESGEAGGGGYDLVTGAYSYTCVNGTLHWTSG